MKKIVIIILLSASPFIAQACDICGCGVGSYYIGILPDFNKKIIGLRYRYNSLHTHIGTGGQTSYLTTKEVYRTAELWGGWTINNRVRLMASVPYNFNEKINQGNTTTKNGIGDISAQAYYQLVNDRHAVGNKLLVQSLWLGGGVKLPTGKYEPPAKNSAMEEVINTFQLGTGSLDFTLNGMYDIRLQDFGVNTSASYKINTRNKEEYRYGNKFTGAAQAYYKFRVLNTTIAPNAGVLYENGQQDADGKFQMDVSGGDILLTTMGAEITMKRISFGGSYQIVSKQHLANGYVKANNRAMVHVAFMF
ncbi:hypothetical protein LX64_02324 [Chitinophaga skermanii]|uniref:Outer membrane beta-barrel porin/alpha-amylase n=1 Tax=Chitinophaga skermanii TaxID=331697 RepID=A0A327QLI9_9BACT|nr:transporter [Chitinophaga skermanii]RAJ05170.1 hypothetical protein LX64_02324 [Chitinophaga skermanii]